MDLVELSRAELQQLCKEHNIKANGKTPELLLLLQSHLSESNRGPRVADRTRASRAPSANTPLSNPPVPEQQRPHVRTRESSRRSQATSRSISTSVTPTVQPEVAAVESEKENKRDPVRRKAKESQKRLGVGKPRAAGGAGARAVTRIIPSRSSATGRTRARLDGPEGNGRMDVVIEEEDGQHQLSGIPAADTSASSHHPTTELDTTALTRRIYAIETQISQLYATRDSLISKSTSQERDLVILRDELSNDRKRLVDDAVKASEARFTQLIANNQAQLADTLQQLESERQRSLRLENQLESLTERLRIVETSFIPEIGLSGSDVHMVTIDPSNPLNLSTTSQEAFATALLGSKRSAPEQPSTPRETKRARIHETHTYTTAARLEDALAQPVSPISAPGTSLILPYTIPPQTPRTPPLTRHARRAMAIPPESPRGGAPSAQLRTIAGGPPSPTTDSPRKGMKGKGKDATGLILVSPMKVKGGRIASSSKPVTRAASSSGAPTTQLAAPQPREFTPRSKPTTSFVSKPVTSPAFPPYEPPSRYNRGIGSAGLGLGRPSTLSGNGTGTISTSISAALNMPTGLLPAFNMTYGSSPRRHSAQSTEEDELKTTTEGTTPDAVLMGRNVDHDDDDDGILHHGGHDHTMTMTPLLSSSMVGGDGMMMDPWNLTSPDDAPPPSPGKRTLYGTEVHAHDDDWM